MRVFYYQYKNKFIDIKIKYYYDIMDSNINTCIYRARCKNNKCSNICDSNMIFCKDHIKYKNIGLFDIINNACGNKIDLLNNKCIYNIFKEIFKYTDSDDLKKKLFIRTLAYLFSYNKKKKKAKYNNIKIKKKAKGDIINDIYLVIYNTYKFKSKNLKYIITIQKNIKKHIIKNINKIYKYEYITNKEDPFTLEDINEIESNLKFYFKDIDNQIYCFNAIEFEYYLRKNNLHPYTKNNINNSIIQKLKLFIYYNNLKTKSNNYHIEENWNTPEQAYTDVVHYMEKIGFYNNILWFNELTFGNIIHIIHVYQDLTENIDISYKFFDNNIIDTMDNNNYQFKFSKEIINLFINGNDHFILCCNFVKSLALVSNKFYNNIPDWLTNITTNENRLFSNEFAIYLNNSGRMITNELDDENNIVDMQLENIIDPATVYYLLDMLNRNN